MAAPTRLSKAKAILATVNYAAEGDIKALQQLSSYAPNALPLEILLRVLLTYLPETIEPTQYVPLLLHLTSGRSQTDEDGHLDLSSVEDLSGDQARQKVRRLRLLPLREPNSTFEATDPLSNFLVRRAHRIDAETGLLNLTPGLVVPFLDQSQELKTWFISTLLPLLRLHYEYYPHSGLSTSLAEFEKLSDGAALGLLLSQARAKGDSLVDTTNWIARDLRGLAGPWAYGRGLSARPKSSKSLPSTETPLGRAEDTRTELPSAWQLVYEWLVWTATKDLKLVVEAIGGWNGPRDADLGGYADSIPGQGEDALEALNLAYAQAAIAVFYAAPSAVQHPFTGHERVLARICSLMHRDSMDLRMDPQALPSVVTDFTALVNSSRGFLLPDMAMRSDNMLTVPSETSLSFLQAILLSSSLLARSGFDNSPRSLADLCLFAAEEVQKDALQRCVRGIAAKSDMDDRKWMQARREFLRLWRWDTEHYASQDDRQQSEGRRGIFGRVPRSFMETELLKAFLLGLHFQAVIETYLGTAATPSPPLPREQVEQAIWEVAMSFYDNATNGNRTRGAMKKASDTIQTFYPRFFPQSAALARAEKLIAATHALSFYSLTLQQRVPFRPVTIRVHSDPIALLGKVLEQNRRCYTKLDDLLAIGRNLVAAGLITAKPDDIEDGPAPSEDDLIRKVERRITSMTIEAALAEDDLETAHRYVLERLPVDTTETDQDVSTSHEQNMARASRLDDDISWRAAFQAGRYKPTTPLSRSSTARALASASSIRSLEMRLELLSHALLLAPAAALAGILAAWQQCDEELQAAVAREADEEEQWDDHVHRKMTGQFIDSSAGSSSAHLLTAGGDDDGPMGLFDVARGAAAALSKTAFPLRGSMGSGRGLALGASQDDVRSTHSQESHEMGEEGRVRKRDQLSNMVTGGLASGIGWVLGATPVQSNTGHDS